MNMEVNIMNPYPKPCTQCGECCKAEPCPLCDGLSIAKKSPCIALEYKDGKHWCGLVVNLAKYRPDFRDWEVEFMQEYLKQICQFGIGCDSD